MYETISSDLLYKHPNKARKKWIGPVLVAYSWSNSSSWGYTNSDGIVMDTWIGFETKTSNQHKYAYIVFWKLAIWIGF
jgi:hypothetical protein